MLNVVASLKFPLALNCWEPFRAIVALLGLTVTDVNVALLTVKVAVPTTPLNAAVMVEVPGATATARPEIPVELLIVATEDLDEVHVTDDVIFCVLPSAK